MELVVGWLVFVAIVGWWANEWGRNPVAWGTAAFLLSPLIAGVVLLLVGRATPMVVAPGTGWQVPASAVVAQDPTAVLASLADLRDRGAISEDEYAAKKADILARI